MRTHGKKEWTDRKELSSRSSILASVLCMERLSACVPSLPGTAWWCIWSTAPGPQGSPPSGSSGDSLEVVWPRTVPSFVRFPDVSWEWSLLCCPCFPWEMLLNWAATSWPVLCLTYNGKEKRQGLHLGISFCLKVWIILLISVDFVLFWFGFFSKKKDQLHFPQIARKKLHSACFHIMPSWCTSAWRNYDLFNSTINITWCFQSASFAQGRKVFQKKTWDLQHCEFFQTPYSEQIHVKLQFFCLPLWLLLTWRVRRRVC